MISSAGFIFWHWLSLFQYQKARNVASQAMWYVSRMDILMLKGKEHMSIGHKAMAGLSIYYSPGSFCAGCNF
jgi:hypothetical protein